MVALRRIQLFGSSPAEGYSLDPLTLPMMTEIPMKNPVSTDGYLNVISTSLSYAVQFVFRNEAKELQGMKNHKF